MKGQEICNGGRRETSNPDTSEEGGNGETKAEAEGEETGAGMEAGDRSVDAWRGYQLPRFQAQECGPQSS